mmetsp:Transcript_37705/g.105016  ORF Transcript_37705/g.105016 Transcript_37705/m.105016 type:complete len:280 (+) Transcript_37705:325-1164(+)
MSWAPTSPLPGASTREETHGRVVQGRRGSWWKPDHTRPLEGDVGQLLHNVQIVAKIAEHVRPARRVPVLLRHVDDLLPHEPSIHPTSVLQVGPLRRGPLDGAAAQQQQGALRDRHGLALVPPLQPECGLAEPTVLGAVHLQGRVVLLEAVVAPQLAGDREVRPGSLHARVEELLRGPQGPLFDQAAQIQHADGVDLREVMEECVPGQNGLIDLPVQHQLEFLWQRLEGGDVAAVHGPLGEHGGMQKVQDLVAQLHGDAPLRHVSLSVRLRPARTLLGRP